MRKGSYLLFVSALALLLTAGCSSNLSSGTSAMGSGTGNATVSLSMTDDPPAGVSVLFFQISLTGATLTPASGQPVSLLSNNTPIQIDVTQLQTLSAFLSTANLAAGTYNSLSLTFANPQLVIYNAADTSLSNCAVGSVCQITPTVDGSAALNFASAPFPATVSAGTPLGFLVNFHLNKIIQPDLSANLSVANGVSVSTLPPMNNPEPPEFGDVTGTVGSVTSSSNQFTIQTRWGRTLTVSTTSGTTYDNFPSSACSAPALSCVAQGQVVRVEIASVASGGMVTAGEVKYLEASNTQTVQGTVIGVYPSTTNVTTSPVTLLMMVHRDPSEDNQFPIGGMVEVSVPPAATLSIDSNGFTMPSGVQFTTPATDFVVGQQLTVAVEAGTVSSNVPVTPPWGHPPLVSFSASSVELEPSEMSGMVTSVDSATASFLFGGSTGPFFFPWPMGAGHAAPTYDVGTTSQTTYRGFTTDAFSGLAAQQYVSLSGWLFATKDSSGNSMAVAQKVVLREHGDL